MDHHLKSMSADELKSMSVDELWILWQEVSSILARKIMEEKAKLEERLRLLENSSNRTRFNRHSGFP